MLQPHRFSILRVLAKVLLFGTYVKVLVPSIYINQDKHLKFLCDVTMTAIYVKTVKTGDKGEIFFLAVKCLG